jgi:Fe-S-cluster containining protein
MTKDEVKELVDNKSDMTYAKAIHSVYDELSSKETLKLACQSGCSLCCRQVVPTSRIEWNEIEKYIDENNLREVILDKNRDTIKEWQIYLRDNWNEIVKNGQKPYNDWLGKKNCIFLGDRGECSIHEVRPLSCRVLTSTSTCTTFSNPDSIIFRYDYERHLMELIWETGHSMSVIDLFSGLK